ncbi:hypothetical protein AMJ44_02620 [candidate division WOR-1 bacterium DG_54_3]|uniref:Hydrogenase maturation nickel metallochaperone HypA n=1 Tax=candidate division WOR-1 bacterium DG_54_3 TaxID=1703775 RepID=A0A0S7Y528_UNCSA|nr:MAG: hypothetical protein AMJ44_02620 [candidate division WOR-1 bacterium DG_54_3]
MHELGLAQDVLEKVKAEAKAKGLSKVIYAKAKIGETLITDPPEFEEIFSTISAGSVAEGMQLDLEILPSLIQKSLDWIALNAVPQISRFLQARNF